ncbi:MAG: hypothetical protein O7D32_04000, partial [bacterium]|nr:hypothetical protein [bacterium]
SATTPDSTKKQQTMTSSVDLMTRFRRGEKVLPRGLYGEIARTSPTKRGVGDSARSVSGALWRLASVDPTQEGGHFATSSENLHLHIEAREGFLGGPTGRLRRCGRLSRTFRPGSVGETGSGCGWRSRFMGERILW